MLEFRKYHGLGNDFLIVEKASLQGRMLSAEEIRRLCDRNRGVGADGVLLVQEQAGEDTSEMVVEMVIFNRDGSRPQMCGNGVRCVAAYAQQVYGAGDRLVVQSDAGPRRCEIHRDDAHRWRVAVDMGRAKVEGEKRFEVGERGYSFFAVNMGNPHGVIFERPDLEAIDEAGRLANDAHPLFPEGVNLEFVASDGEGFDVVVFERGVGRTEACGTGACAVAVAAWEKGFAPCEKALRVNLPGGPLWIEDRDGNVWMSGAAAEVFAGRWLA